MRHRIFVPGVGAHGNIGDVVLRRQLLTWLRPLGELHVYVGASSDSYDRALGLRDADVTYRRFTPWLTAGLSTSRRDRLSYVFKPGEIQLTLPGLKEHVGVLPLAVAARAHRGAVLRVGAGAKNFSRPPLLLLRPSLWLADAVWWRDADTAAFVGTGQAAPDLAFGEGPGEEELRARDQDRPRRDQLVVTMRGDRPSPRPEWVAAVRRFADRHDLRLVTVSQVRDDDERTVDLGRALGARCVPWSGRDHGEQEACVRRHYGAAAAVVSDRLHALIMGVTEGAVPIGLATDTDRKIDRHFATIGLDRVCLPSGEVGEDELVAFMEHGLQRGPDVRRRLLDARRDLTAVRRDLERRLGPARSGTEDRSAPPTTSTAPGRGGPVPHRWVAYHVGRRGSVAGGMTQVVNGYLEWRFQDFDVQVVRSRDGSTGFRAVRRAAAAVVEVASLRRDRPGVVVAHLSQGGSLIREGLALVVAKRRGWPTIAQLHGSNFVPFARRRPRLVRWVLRHADGVMSLSAGTTAVVRELVPDAVVEELPNAVPRGTEAPKQRRVLFGGAVGRRKGVDVLITAWEQADLPPGWELRIAGPVLEPDLVRDVPGVRWLGPLEHADLMRELESAAVAVLPSRGEAMPMFLIEAMARGCCIVASDVGGVAALLRGGSGLLVPPDDAPAVTRALVRVLTDDRLRTQLARAASARHATSFSAEAVLPRVEQFWARVAGGTS